ncbi:short-chain dehydrogenase/reductase SDR [Acetobacter malorum DSM 14337]|uniref:Short-chain dehydrogenase/reductase SDR n=1 Tax=Acetobacter malorum DSM 14337 TaxID=1307910 RepID=A0ABQ0PQK5_9PROT|nr:SDR family NAD(P)-dependent oxidoreductase [Acetobacter malorum]KXV05551.1 shikimate dehydrogenase [Acetobacter malorum]GBQ77973.1 short-chain dehydrogenase/reductase SDR [Acetobacter malorum DSM 14337]
MTESFNATSTTDQVLDGFDLTGKRVLVTGVSAGLGVETARTLLAHGAQVIGTARDLAKAEAATALIRTEAAGTTALELEELDLASLRSVRACAERISDAGKPFDLIVANAGIMGVPLSHTEDGFELHFGTNYLGHFVFVNRLAPLMRPGARLITLSSAGHRFADVDLEDPNFEHTPYDPFMAYGRSKTADSLFAVAFDHRHRNRGVRAAAVHPGGIQTELARYTNPAVLQGMIDTINAELAAQGKPPYTWKTIPQGAATTVWAGIVASADDIGGRYCEDCHVSPVVTAQTVSMVSEGVRPYAIDPERAEALWARSEELVNEAFPA